MDRILNAKAQSAFILGLCLQLAMIIEGHFYGALVSVFIPLGCLIAFISGLVYAVGSQKVAMWERAYGGALIGGASALIAIIASIHLGETEIEILMIGTLLSGIAGAMGGMIGREWSIPQHA
jgi:hypothetical protein